MIRGSRINLVRCSSRPLHCMRLINEPVEDTMENWDEDKLRKVVLSKHGNPRTTTDVRTSPHLSDGPLIC